MARSTKYVVDITELNDERRSLVFIFVPNPEHGNGRWIRGQWVSNQYTVKAAKDAAGISYEWSHTSDAPGPAKAEIEEEVAARLNDRAVWLERVTALVAELEGWAHELGWSTRRLEKSLEDARIGKHRVPALLLQQDLCRIMLEPVGSSAPGSEGVVDLYLMPAYDDIATLLFYQNRWNIHLAFTGENADARTRPAEPRPLSKQTWNAVLDGLRQNAA